MPSIQLSSIDDPRLQPPQRERWQDGALCTQVDPDIFFPAVGGSTYDAKAVCNACPKVLDCLDYVFRMERNDYYREGIFAGLSPSQRRKIAKLMQEKRMSLNAAYVVVKSKESKKVRSNYYTPDALKASQELQTL